LFDEGSSNLRDLLGGKGADLAEMIRLGLPIPLGMTVTTEVCNYYNSHNNKFPEGMEQEVLSKLKNLESRTGRIFGDPKNPLLLSIRSGAPISMPGMMDTVLNLGLNDQTIKGLIELTNNDRFAYDCFRRFVQMFGNVVLGVPGDKFEAIIQRHKDELKVKLDVDLGTKTLAAIVQEFKELIKQEKQQPFPDDPLSQLWMAIAAVFRSWNGKRAKIYRQANDIPDTLGTAVNIQSMVFGNIGLESGTGVCFTRNPSTGEPVLYGEFLMNAQGEDVVAGTRTPQPISQLAHELPHDYRRLVSICALLSITSKTCKTLNSRLRTGHSIFFKLAPANVPHQPRSELRWTWYGKA